VLELSFNWNIILIVIGGCSLVSFTVFIERLLYLRKSEIDTNHLLIRLRKAIQEGNIVEAVQTCETMGGKRRQYY
jgi:biopolymer transport protein ExbB